MPLTEIGPDGKVYFHATSCRCLWHQCRSWLRYVPRGDREIDGATVKIARTDGSGGGGEPDGAYDLVVAEADFRRALGLVPDGRLRLVAHLHRTLPHPGVLPRGSRPDGRPARLVVEAMRRRRPAVWAQLEAEFGVPTLAPILDRVATEMAAIIGQGPYPSPRLTDRDPRLPLPEAPEGVR